MLLCVPALAAHDGFQVSNLIRYLEPKPMIPQDGQIQVRDEPSVGRVSENIINAGGFDDFIQRGGIVSQRAEVFFAA